MSYYNPKKKMGRTIIVENNNVEKAISKLRHTSAQLMKEVRERRAYEKPSDKRRRKMKICIRNVKKQQRLKELYS